MFLIPLSRGGGMGSALAGVCFSAFSLRVYKHTPPPLSRGESHISTAFLKRIAKIFFLYIKPPPQPGERTPHKTKGRINPRPLDAS